MQIGICSYSFHRLLAEGKQDIFKFIDDCKELGCTQLDPWNAHLAEVRAADDGVPVGVPPEQAGKLSPSERAYVERVRDHGLRSGLPFGTIAVDGAHIYEADAAKRDVHRARAYRWLEVAEILGARQVRIDAGGPESMPEESFAIIRDGYRDLIARCRKINVELLIENHWGPSAVPDNVARILGELPGLGLLYDTHNWKPELRAEGRARFAKHARAVHIKTFRFDSEGNETEADIPTAVGHLRAAGYAGTWGVESVPRDGDEYAGAKKTIALIKRIAA
jgi:sugar phosphate isomerase/epimerase